MSDWRKDVRVLHAGKGGSSYDPQIDAAAAQEAQTAQQAQDWTENYYTTEIDPALQAEENAANTTTSEEQQLFNVNMQSAQQQQQLYNQYGVPATQNYYDMVNSYSAPQMEQTQAEAALGDNMTAQGAAQQTFQQQLGAAGISASSPGAIQAEQQMDTANAANNAAAETRARNAAQQLGIQLTSDAVNVANGNASQIVNSTGAASGNSQATTAAAATDTGSTTSAATPEDSAATIATNAYGNNLSAYSKLGAADIAASAQEGTGLGQMLGSVAGMSSGGGGTVAGDLLGSVGIGI